LEKWLPDMVDIKKTAGALNLFLRPQTDPVAVRMCVSSDELPEKARRPKRDLGISVPVCQGLAMARRYGWTVAVGKEDQACPHGHAVMGFVPKELYANGILAEEAGVGKKEAFAQGAKALTTLEYGKYRYLLVAPLEKAEFEPDFIMFFGNPAQTARLVQALTFKSDTLLHFVAGGGRACSVFIARTILTEECQVVLAGAGDRYFALTQDHEMAFTIPVSRAEEVVEGLEMSHRAGLRYPTPSWLRFEGQLPPAYYKFSDLLLQEGRKQDKDPP
jgi:uncharacterized protein (DUF169 family)